MSKAKTEDQPETGSGQKIRPMPLAQLHLDPGNPRLGGYGKEGVTETKILDTIVELFGIDDLLSSMAVNGYFDAEPMIGVWMAGGRDVRVKEGNRRLAACLILAGDARAKNQEKRMRDYREIQAKHKRPPIAAVPVIVYDQKVYTKNLLSYMGVRHIAASQPWDSYAKAAWIADVLEHGRLSLEDIGQMVGDQHRTIERMLEGYYFVKQLVDTGRFSPRDSLRKGRGSNPEYPFSWIYTALGFKPIRNWLGLDDLAQGRKPKPVPTQKLDDARDLLVFLLGDKGRKRQAVIADSRQIADLAIAVGEPERREMLKRGKTLEEILELAKPVAERVSTGLYDAQDSLTYVVVALSQGEITQEEAKPLEAPSRKVKALAADAHEKIMGLIVGREEAKDA